jgi:hypothetical protein
VILVGFYIFGYVYCICFASDEKRSVVKRATAKIFFYYQITFSTGKMAKPMILTMEKSGDHTVFREPAHRLEIIYKLSEI